MNWWQWILTTCGAITTLSGAIIGLKKILQPYIQLRKDVNSLMEHDRSDLVRFTEIEGRLIRDEKGRQAVYKALLSIINHSIDGNSIESMKHARDTLNQHIIESETA